MRNDNIITQIAKWEKEKQRISKSVEENLYTDDYLLRMSQLTDLELARVMRLLNESLDDCLSRVERGKTA